MCLAASAMYTKIYRYTVPVNSTNSRRMLKANKQVWYHDKILRLAQVTVHVSCSRAHATAVCSTVG